MSDLDDAVRWCVKQSYSAMLQVIGDRAVKELADLRKENDQLRKAVIDMARLATKHPFFVSDGTKLREMAEDIIKEYGKEQK